MNQLVMRIFLYFILLALTVISCDPTEIKGDPKSVAEGTTVPIIPSFFEAGKSYYITTVNGESSECRVLEVDPSGWIRVTHFPNIEKFIPVEDYIQDKDLNKERWLWINIKNLISIEYRN